MSVQSPTSGHSVQQQHTHPWGFRVSPTIQKIAAFALIAIAVSGAAVASPVTAGAVALATTAAAGISPLLLADRKRGLSCNSATTASTVGYQTYSTTVSGAPFTSQSIGQSNSTGYFLEAFATSTGISFYPLTPTLTSAGSSFSVNYQSPGTGATNVGFNLVPQPGGNFTVPVVYNQLNTGAAVADCNVINGSGVLSTSSYLLPPMYNRIQLNMGSVETADGMLTAIVSGSATSLPLNLLLYSPTCGTPTLVSLTSASVYEGQISASSLPNGNVVIVYTTSSTVYGLVVTPTGSIVVDPVEVGTCSAGAPVSVVCLTNGNIVFVMVNSSGQAYCQIVNSTFSEGVMGFVVDGCTGESNPTVAQVGDGFVVFVEQSGVLSGYYFDPSGQLLGKVPVTAPVGTLPVYPISPLQGASGHNQMVVAIPQSGGSSVVVDLFNTDPETSTASATSTSTKTSTGSFTASSTATSTETSTASATASFTATATGSPTASATASFTATPTSTATSTPSSTATATPTPTIPTVPPPTPPAIGLIPYGAGVTTGQYSTVDLSQVFNAQGPLNIIAKFNPEISWAGLSQDSTTKSWYIWANAPYAAANSQFTVILNATSGLPPPEGQQLPFTTVEFLVGVNGESLAALIPSIVLPITGVTISLAVGWRAWKRRAQLATEKAKQLGRSLSRRGSMEQDVEMQAPAGPPPAYSTATGSSANLISSR